jgi:hypothetical protein
MPRCAIEEPQKSVSIRRAISLSCSRIQLPKNYSAACVDCWIAPGRHMNAEDEY